MPSSLPRRNRQVRPTSATAPIATGWSDSCRVGFAPTERPCLCTAHRERRGMLGTSGSPPFYSFSFPSKLVASRRPLSEASSWEGSERGDGPSRGATCVEDWTGRWSRAHVPCRAMTPRPFLRSTSDRDYRPIENPTSRRWHAHAPHGAFEILTRGSMWQADAAWTSYLVVRQYGANATTTIPS
jgi:hypothetical protein